MKTCLSLLIGYAIGLAIGTFIWSGIIYGLWNYIVPLGFEVSPLTFTQTSVIGFVVCLLMWMLRSKSK